MRSFLQAGGFPKVPWRSWPLSQALKDGLGVVDGKGMTDDGDTMAKVMGGESTGHRAGKQNR